MGFGMFPDILERDPTNGADTGIFYWKEIKKFFFLETKRIFFYLFIFFKATLGFFFEVTLHAKIAMPDFEIEPFKP